MKILFFNLHFLHSDSTKRGARANHPFKYLFIVLALPKLSSSVKKSIVRDLYVYLKCLKLVRLHNLFNVYK